MTTRRRRAGSETSPEEQFLIPVQATQQPQQPQQPQQQPFTLLNQVPGWRPSANTNTAYYKKTDTVNPQLGTPTVGVPSAGVPSPAPGSYNQFWAVPQNPLTTPGVPANIGHWNPASATGVSGTNSTGFRTSGGVPSGGFQSSSKFSYSGTLSSLDDGDMASRDRTTEFTRIWRSQQGSQTNGALPHQNKRMQDMRQYTEFMNKSRLIGRHIYSTYAKLEKMTHLAKKRSLFDDSHDREMQELTGIIRHDLTSLTKQLEDLRNRSSNADYTSSNNHIKKHSHNLVGSLQIKVAGITQAFKDVLEIRTENLKMQHERREQFTGGVVNGDFAPSAMTGHHQGSVLLADEAASANGAAGGGYGGSSGNSEVAINMGAASSGSQYNQQLMLMEEQDSLLQSRADTMKTIESTIVELGSMFSQLATMVKEQEELVHRIDTNVEDAGMNVEAAHTELLRYFKSVSSNRMLMFKVFGIMIVFFIIFVVFMA